jgi:hypothetical protein
VRRLGHFSGIEVPEMTINAFESEIITAGEN